MGLALRETTEPFSSSNSSSENIHFASPSQSSCITPRESTKRCRSKCGRSCHSHALPRSRTATGCNRLAGAVTEASDTLPSVAPPTSICLLWLDLALADLACCMRRQKLLGIFCPGQPSLLWVLAPKNLRYMSYTRNELWQTKLSSQTFT